MKVIKAIGLVLVYTIYLLALTFEWLIDMSQRVLVVVRNCIEEVVTGDIGLKQTIDKLRK